MRRFTFLLKHVALSFYTKSTMIFVVVMVLMAILSAWAIPKGDVQKQKDDFKVSFSLVDEDQSFLSQILLEQVKGLPNIKEVYLENQEQAQKRMEKNETLLYVIIPEGFYQNVVQGEKGLPLVVHLNEKMPSEGDFFVRLFRHISGSLASVQTGVYAWGEFASSLNLTPEELQKEEKAAAASLMVQLIGRGSIIQLNKEGRFDSLRFVLSSLSILMALIPGLLILMVDEQDRKNGVYAGLRLCTVPWWQIQGSRILVCSLWSILSYTPFLLVLKNFFPDLQMGYVILVLTLILLCSCFLCTIFGAMGLEGDQSVMAGWLLLVLLMLLGGGIYPPNLMPRWLQMLSGISPVSWGIENLYRNLWNRPQNHLGLLVMSMEVLAAGVASYIGGKKIT